MAEISIVIPVFNEQECLPALFDRLQAVRQAAQDDLRLLFVDDGSQDDSRRIIQDLAARHDFVQYVFLSRNFGHEAAIAAGLDAAAGEAVVVIDADLQNPPETIPALIAKWREGCQVVYARRQRRNGEGLGKRLGSWLFYRAINRLTDVAIPVDTGDFQLLDRRVVEALGRCREQNRFTRGLVSWLGFRQAGVEYDCQERFAGKTKYGVWGRVSLALDAVSGFSHIPLRLGVLAGAVVCAIALVWAAVIAVRGIFWSVAAWPQALLTAGIFFLGGVQLLVLGIVGLYVGRAYRQAQGRPLYVVSESALRPREASGGD